MILIVSDLHLGKDAKKKGRSKHDDQSLSDLVECVRSMGPKLKEVVFLGDTFDAFIEYKRHVPESVVKWTRVAAEIQQMNVKVRFFAGNHDRWHCNYIQSNLQIDIQRDPAIVRAEGINIWMEHGDSAAPNSRLVQFIRETTDQPWAFFLYKLVLPFGLGQKLAAYVSRTFSNFKSDPETIEGLKSYAFDVLLNEPVELVVMGHCHQSCLERPPDASPANPKSLIYANAGDWYQSRTFILVSDSVQLCRWSANSNTILQKEIF